METTGKRKKKIQGGGRDSHLISESTKNKPKTMSESVQGQMVFCSMEEERTIEAMV